MKHKRLLSILLVTLFGAILLSAYSTAQRRRGSRHPRSGPPASGAFTPTCANPSYPSPAPTQSLAIDAQCGLDGNGTGAEAAQNDAKDNFCAAGPAQTITIAEMRQLQSQVEQNHSINFGNSGPTTDRSPLKTLGEGNLVTIEKAYVLIARQEGKESVNCGSKFPNKTDVLAHDIHISLVESPDTPLKQECESVVVEMSPHHRPDQWNATKMQQVASAKVPVKVTGHLFFDSSHVPCRNGQRVGSNPARSSLWEIHPIYKFEVCTSGCDGAGTWVPLDRWTPPRRRGRQRHT